MDLICDNGKFNVTTGQLESTIQLRGCYRPQSILPDSIRRMLRKWDQPDLLDTIAQLIKSPTVVMVYGGPHTGKTTLMKLVMKLFRLSSDFQVIFTDNTPPQDLDLVNIPSRWWLTGRHKIIIPGASYIYLSKTMKPDRTVSALVNSETFPHYSSWLSCILDHLYHAQRERSLIVFPTEHTGLIQAIKRFYGTLQGEYLHEVIKGQVPSIIDVYLSEVYFTPFVTFLTRTHNYTETGFSNIEGELVRLDHEEYVEPTIICHLLDETVSETPKMAPEDSLTYRYLDGRYMIGSRLPSESENLIIMKIKSQI